MNYHQALCMYHIVLASPLLTIVGLRKPRLVEVLTAEVRFAIEDALVAMVRRQHCV